MNFGPQYIVVTFTEGVVDLGDHGDQRFIGAIAEVETHRVEDVAADPRQGVQRDAGGRFGHAALDESIRDLRADGPRSGPCVITVMNRGPRAAIMPEASHGLIEHREFIEIETEPEHAVAKGVYARPMTAVLCLAVEYS